MPALITPFNSDGTIIRNTVKELLDFNYSKGVDGFYICGSSGEGPVLSLASRMAMAEAVIENNNNRGVIIAHIGSHSFNDTLELTKHATNIGVDAISSLAPNFYYNYTDNEIIEFYKAIADVTDKPVLVYATAMLKTGNLVRLVESFMKIKNVIGLKFTIRDYFLLRKVKEVNGGNINIINGPDETLLCGLVMGADAGIGTTYTIMPEIYSNLYEAFITGDLKTAQECQYKINRIIDILIKHSDNGAIKATKETLRLMGYNVGKCAEPAKTYTKTEIDALKADLMGIGFTI